MSEQKYCPICGEALCLRCSWHSDDCECVEGFSVEKIDEADALDAAEEADASKEEGS